MDDFDLTSGTLARSVGTSVVTINRYAKLGLLDFKLASDGTRLFRRGQESRLRETMGRRLANRGKRD